jgi:hypothetical protein
MNIDTQDSIFLCLSIFSRSDGVRPSDSGDGGVDVVREEYVVVVGLPIATVS